MFFLSLGVDLDKLDEFLCDDISQAVMSFLTWTVAAVSMHI